MLEGGLGVPRFAQHMKHMVHTAVTVVEEED